MSRNTRLRLLGTAGLLVAAACHDGAAPTDPAFRPNLGLQAPQAVDLAALARTVPGFGGFYLDDGAPTVYLTDVRQRPAAVAALARYGFAASAIRVKPGDFAYQDLDRWFQRLSPEALALTGTVFVDLDEAINRVAVGVEDRGAAPAVKSVVARLGLPERAVTIVEAEPIYPAATLRDRIRPTVGGIQIHFSSFLCTLGFNAVDAGENSFITNSHCTDRQGGVEGTVYYQPTSSDDPNSIGTEVEDPAYFRGGACPRGRKCRYSDASRAAYAAGVTFDLGGIAATGLGSLTITGTHNVTAEGSASKGQTVRKVGRTTGTTEGKVSKTCANTGVSGSNIVQLCQTWVAAGVGAGDSGSPVYMGSGNVTLLGILWGGNSSGTTYVYSPMSGIEREIGSLTTF